MTTKLFHSSILGVVELISQPFTDDRGIFLNAFRSNEPAFAEAWGDRSITQVNFSRTDSVGSVRGIHLQATPHSEAKLVRCLRGRVWDVAVDLRLNSITYGKWHAVELSSDQSNCLIIPEGCGHGYQVLEPNSELLYLHSGEWVPKLETGIKFNDPHLCVSWPLAPLNVSKRDLELPLLELNK